MAESLTNDQIELLRRHAGMLERGHTLDAPMLGALFRQLLDEHDALTVEVEGAREEIGRCHEVLYIEDPDDPMNGLMLPEYVERLKERMKALAGAFERMGEAASEESGALRKMMSTMLEAVLSEGLLSEGLLSEGQVSTLLDLDRTEVRELRYPDVEEQDHIHVWGKVYDSDGSYTRACYVCGEEPLEG